MRNKDILKPYKNSTLNNAFLKTCSDKDLLNYYQEIKEKTKNVMSPTQYNSYEDILDRIRRELGERYYKYLTEPTEDVKEDKPEVYYRAIINIYDKNNTCITVKEISIYDKYLSIQSLQKAIYHNYVEVNSYYYNSFGTCTFLIKENNSKFTFDSIVSSVFKFDCIISSVGNIIIFNNEKKKVFISLPFRNRTNENILKNIDSMHKIAEKRFGQKLEPVHNFFIPGDDNEIIVPDNVNKSIYFLSEAIKKMSTVDYFIGITEGYSNGCDVETKIARDYNIEKVYLSIQEMKELMPDIF